MRREGEKADTRPAVGRRRERRAVCFTMVAFVDFVFCCKKICVKLLTREKDISQSSKTPTYQLSSLNYPSTTSTWHLNALEVAQMATSPSPKQCSMYLLGNCITIKIDGS